MFQSMAAHLRSLVPWLLLFVLMVGCSRVYTDPFTYCAAVGTIDAPDERYDGESVPQSIASGLRAAFGLPDEAPLEPFMRGTHWRCMDGKVYACNVGANLPCLEKANTSRTPTPPMVKYCRDNPDAENIPAVVTGRATVYSWACEERRPTIVRQVTEPDARGFLANVWHRIEPGGR
jgi:hypothetical protein